jgi:amino acid adenylation domain-containing protein
LFINTIPVRVKYESTNTPIELLKTLQEQSIQSSSHHYMNLSEVQSLSEPGMHLVNHIMIFENYAVKELTGEGALNNQIEEGLSVESMEVFERTNYDFNLIISPSYNSLGITIVYNANRYDGLLLRRLKEHFGNLISEFTTKADQPLTTLNYLSGEEKQELLFTFNDTEVDYPRDKTIVDLFEEQVERTPDDVAVVFEDTEVTYRELNARSNQLADYLQKKYKTQPDDLIGIKQDRSEWMIVSILGVLKSGGAYVPIDPEYPQERIDYIEKDTKCKVCIDEKELNKFRENQKKYSIDKITSGLKPNNLAYVIYTSGSTGKPKGVLIEHKNVINFFTAMNSIFDKKPGVILSVTKLTFDISVLELFWTLSNGYKVVIQGRVYGGPENYSVYSQIKKHKVSHLQLTPSMAGILNSHFTKDTDLYSIEKILLGGERVTASLVKSLYEKLSRVQIYNMYGPTETTVWSTVSELEQYAEKIVIGKPIANTSIYILDDEQHLLPVGIQGEIYIGGEGLARGYTNKELTEQKFIKNPYRPGERLYRTGDFGSWLSDGSIDYSGRKDDMVKVRGYRIELGEIENALLRNEQIKEAVALAKENDRGEKELVAYITAKTKQNASDLRYYLKEILPEHMLPDYYVQLEALPLTTNGKVDRKLLPDPQDSGLVSGTEYVAPRNETEENLVKIWQELLKRENIGINDDFFELGGNSLKASQLLLKIKKNLGVKLDLRNFLSKPTIDGLSEAITTLVWMKDKSKEESAEQDEIII